MDPNEERRQGWLGRLLGRAPAETGPRVVAFPAAPQSGGARCTRRRPPAAGGGGAAPAPAPRGNATTTTKYTLLSFLPKSLFEQYRRGAAQAARGRARRQQCSGFVPLGATATAAASPPQPPPPQARRQHLLHDQRGAVGDALQPRQVRARARKRVCSARGVQRRRWAAQRACAARARPLRRTRPRRAQAVDDVPAAGPGAGRRDDQGGGGGLQALPPGRGGQQQTRAGARARAAERAARRPAAQR